MGLLTDPRVGRGKLTKFLLKYHGKLCCLLYFVGIVWFSVLAHDNFNAGTYFSENALLPGLVKGDYEERQVARDYLKDLMDEAARHPDSVPYAWLLAKFGQLNLETFTHNYTINYPLVPGTKYQGKNVYAILRAPRSASTEALVLTAPYRPPSSVHLTTLPSIALILSLARFFRWQKYWAKDIIFLITEHEQLGIQAWLEAYHSAPCGKPGVLEHGNMKGRSGAIQAAVNLELHAEKVGYIDVKVEGLNGQLPNLDLVNLMHRMCAKEGVKHTFKNRENRKFHDEYKEWLYAFKTLMAMVATQATGIPNGNHGLFHRFGIEAVTLEGFERGERGSSADFYQLGRVLEGVFRSLNNLLERFHQSYFFYLQPATDRYISIGMYMPPLGLMCAGLFLKAFALWLNMYDDPKHEESDSVIEFKNKGLSSSSSAIIAKEEIEPVTTIEEENFDNLETENWLNMTFVGTVMLAAHGLGFVMSVAAPVFCSLGLSILGTPTDISVFMGYIITNILLLFMPVCFRDDIKTAQNSSFLNIVALLELGTLLLAVAMYNFSLSLLTALLYVPVALSISPIQKHKFVGQLQKLLWILLHPLSLLLLSVLTFTFLTFPNDRPTKLFLRAVGSSRQALVYAIVDAEIYGNWLFHTATLALFPVWLLFWTVLHTPGTTKNVQN